MSDDAYAVVIDGRTYVEMYEAQRLIREARAEALEEAAKVCDKISGDVFTTIGRENAGWMRATAQDCAMEIRKLKEKA